MIQQPYPLGNTDEAPIRFDLTQWLAGAAIAQTSISYGPGISSAGTAVSASTTVTVPCRWTVTPSTSMNSHVDLTVTTAESPARRRTFRVLFVSRGY
jgi:hypothetical protein